METWTANPRYPIDKCAVCVLQMRVVPRKVFPFVLSNQEEGVFFFPFVPLTIYL
jgi:hypothetical protein